MDPVVVVVVRGALALLLGVAASHKARDLRRFAAVVSAYRVVPDALAGVVAVLVPLLEAAAAVLLLVPTAGPAGPLLAAALLTAYAVGIGANLARGRRDLDCGCGAPGSARPIAGWMMVRNVLLAGAALASLAPAPARVLVWVDAVTVAAAVAALAALYAAVDRLAANVPAIARVRGAA